MKINRVKNLLVRSLKRMPLDEDGAREQWQLAKARFPGLTVERCLWFFKNHMSEEKAQRWVEGLRRAQVES